MEPKASKETRSESFGSFWRVFNAERAAKPNDLSTSSVRTRGTDSCKASQEHREKRLCFYGRKMDKQEPSREELHKKDSTNVILAYIQKNFTYRVHA